MNKFWQTWFSPYWEGEGGSGGGSGDGGAGGGDSAAGGDKGGGEGAGGDKGTTQVVTNQNVSLRASVAQTLEGDERADFERWGGQYNTDTEFAKAIGSMRRQFDTRVPVPKPDDKPEAVSKYFERVGKPPEPKAYAYDFGKDEKGEPVKLSDKEAADFEGYKEYAHKHHFTQAQFKAGMDFLLERDRKDTVEFTGKVNEAHQRSVDQLREEWGADFDNNVNYAVEGGILYADDESSWRSFTELTLANGMKVGDHPTFVKTFAKIGRATSEDQMARNMRASGEAENVKQQIAAIEEEAMKAGELPSDEKWHRRLEPLYKKLYPKTHRGGSAGYGA